MEEWPVDKHHSLERHNWRHMKSSSSIMLELCADLASFDPSTFDFDATITEDVGDVGGFYVSDIPSLSPNVSCGADSVELPISGKPITEAEETETVSSRKLPKRSNEESTLVLPRGVKHDMRLAFVQRFMSSVSSGDFEEVQNFSKMFIRPDAPLDVRFQNDEAFYIPKCLCGVGPRSHILYMLGCFVMFPDMIVRMGQAQLITSNYRAGTKIILPWQCLMTKTHHIPDALWVLPDQAIEWLNKQESSVDVLLSTLSLQNGAASSQDRQIDEAHTMAHRKTKQAHSKKKRKRRTHVSQVLAQNDLSQLVPHNVARKIENSAVRFSPTPKLWVQGVHIFELDENHYVTSISVRATQERQVGIKELA